MCRVPPAPELRHRLREEFEEAKERAGALLAPRLRMTETDRVGFNDGLIYPGTNFPVGTTAEVARRAALERAPLRGIVRVIVVLVDFPDKRMDSAQLSRFSDLFFSTGVLPHGSVKEYFTDVSGGLITLEGEIVGPYTMPLPLAAYAGSENGTQDDEPNARTMASDAVTAAEPDVDFLPYDNDGNGYVDAFIVAHAGRGAEETGAAGDIWSHKWVLPAERTVDRTKIFAYLTIPEDAKIGVCAHEIGHLVFGWPDLYDTDYSSEGIGNWCLMAGGAWGLGGDRPVHPSAWCKLNQGWVTAVNHVSDALITVSEVKAAHTVSRLWMDGTPGNEYFLVENRLRSGYDASLPGEGLLVWHIDDAVSTNRDERHYKVALVQADARKDLENNSNRGDDGDPFPGATNNVAFTDSTNPNSRSYAGAGTCVSITEIPQPGPSMTLRIAVRCPVRRPTTLEELADDVQDLGRRLTAVEATLESLRVASSFRDRPTLRPS